MALNFGDHDEVIFQHAPLETVVVQIHFPQILALWNEVGLTGIQTLLREEYPIFQQGGPGIRLWQENQPEPPPVWRLVSEDETWVVGISPNFISLETLSYQTFEDFLVRLNRVLFAVRRSLRPGKSMRIGLRKINVFEPTDRGAPFSYSHIINPQILGLLAVDDFPAPLTGIASVTEFMDGQHRLMVRSGLNQNAQNLTAFVLDLDYSTSQQLEIKEGEVLESMLLEFSQGISSFFHWAVLDSYKLKLMPVPKETGVNHV